MVAVTGNGETTERLYSSLTLTFKPVRIIPHVLFFSNVRRIPLTPLTHRVRLFRCFFRLL